MLTSLSKLDALDGHIYWNQYVGVGDVPMVNDPLHSTVVQLSRTAFAGKPYTVSETNHPFPNEYASEGIPILAAYAGFQDWDMIVMYTFEPKKDPAWKPYVGDPFDISHDPVRMTEMAAGALMFLRGDVKPARQTVERTYSTQQVMDAGLLPGGLRGGSEQPYFTPGFPLSLPLEHGVRIKSFDGPPTAHYDASAANPIVSDTKELSWYTSDAKTGLVTVETDSRAGPNRFRESEPQNPEKPERGHLQQLRHDSSDFHERQTAGKRGQDALERVFTRGQYRREMERRPHRARARRSGPLPHAHRAGDGHRHAA